MDIDVRLELLTADHARPLERFERANRAFFAARVGDRGDDYFEHFDDRLAGLIREMEAGTSLFYVILSEDGEIMGRVNLADVDRPDVTELGFRVAERTQGCGFATRGVLAALDAAARHGVETVKARVAVDNVASRRVVERCGFELVGPAEAPVGSTEAFVGYRKILDRSS